RVETLVDRGRAWRGGSRRWSTEGARVAWRVATLVDRGRARGVEGRDAGRPRARTWIPGLERLATAGAGMDPRGPPRSTEVARGAGRRRLAPDRRCSGGRPVCIAGRTGSTAWEPRARRDSGVGRPLASSCRTRLGTRCDPWIHVQGSGRPP